MTKESHSLSKIGRTGRQREIIEIVKYRRAAVVGQLLLGELDVLPHIDAANYDNRPRREIKAEVALLRQELRGEIERRYTALVVNLKQRDEDEILVRVWQRLVEIFRHLWARRQDIG